MTNEKNFSIQAWHDEGEKHYVKLETEVNELRAQLEAKEKEKQELGILLGKDQPSNVTRIQVKRPVMSAYRSLHLKGDDHAEVRDFVQAVMKNNSDLDEKRIMTCLRDLSRSGEIGLDVTNNRLTALKSQKK